MLAQLSGVPGKKSRPPAATPGPKPQCSVSMRERTICVGLSSGRPSMGSTGVMSASSGWDRLIASITVGAMSTLPTRWMSSW